VSNNGIGGGFDNAQQVFAKVAPIVGGIVVVVVLSIAGLSRVGCVNEHTPPGHAGYVRSNPIFGAGEFVGTQRGPTSTGWVWRQEVVNIDMRPRTFTEEMTILTSQGSELRFRAHARIELTDEHGGVKAIVERFGGQAWYANNVQRQFQAEVRANVQPREPFEVKNNSVEIAEHVRDVLKERYAETPIRFIDVHIGDIRYPEGIVAAVIEKFVTFHENERRDIELKIAQKQIEIGEAKARGIADAQKIIRTTLDPMLLQLEALGAIEQLAASEGTTFVVQPAGRDGTAPLIMNLGN
jgi:regulator of protease activity HflC (stomatin/prohibitin superfamily)